jgi:GNAT superfamily N-acetyltransferase
MIPHLGGSYRIEPARGPDDRRSFGALLDELLRWDVAMSRANGLDVDTMLHLHHEHTTEDLLAEFAPPLGRLLLASDEVGAFGCCALRPLDSQVGEVKSLYVRPSHRGRGAASALMRSLVAEARMIGYRTLRLTTARFMSDAHRVYEAIGFRRIGPYYEVPAALRDADYYMELALR